MFLNLARLFFLILLPDIDDWTHEIERVNRDDLRNSVSKKGKDIKAAPVDIRSAKISRLASAANAKANPLSQNDALAPTFEASLDAMQDAEIKLQVAQMSFNPAVLKDQLKKCNLEDLYKNSTAKSRHNPPGMIADPVHLKPTGPVLKWTYQLLVESKPISNFTNLVLRDLRALYEELHNLSSARHEFEWSIMVDKYKLHTSLFFFFFK